MEHNRAGTEECWTYSLNLVNDPRAPRIARITLRGVLGLYGMAGAFIDTAELLASELVTNAVQHTKGPSALRITGSDRRLRLGVRDTDPAVPAFFDRAPRPDSWQRPKPAAEHGRGLDLVRLCAYDWGAYALGDPLYGTAGKLLWVELAREAEEFGIAA